MARLLFIALQLVVTLLPGESVDVTCLGQRGPVQTSPTLVTIPCEAEPPPGTVVLGDHRLLPDGGGGVYIHQSAGSFVAGPGSAPRLTAEGAFQVDDRAGSWFTGLGCVLDHIEVHVGGDYRGGTDGAALIRVYVAETAQVSGLLTPTPGWVAVSQPTHLTSADPGLWRSFAFTGAHRIVTAPSMWWAVDWQPTTNTFYNMLEVRFNLYDGVQAFLNDGTSRRTLSNQGVPLATPAYRIFESC